MGLSEAVVTLPDAGSVGALTYWCVIERVKRDLLGQARHANGFIGIQRGGVCRCRDEGTMQQVQAGGRQCSELIDWRELGKCRRKHVASGVESGAKRSGGRIAATYVDNLLAVHPARSQVQQDGRRVERTGGESWRGSPYGRAAAVRFRSVAWRGSGSGWVRIDKCRSRCSSDAGARAQTAPFPIGEARGFRVGLAWGVTVQERRAGSRVAVPACVDAWMHACMYVWPHALRTRRCVCMDA